MHTTLVSVETLAQHLDDPHWVICDCRHDLMFTGAGRRAYRKAHIPGARFLHLDDDLSGAKTGRNGRHPLPEPRVIAERLGRLGIGNDSQVIAYDAKEGYYAARLWWTLRWLGHEAVAVLDGGWEAWIRAGHTTTRQSPEATPATFAIRPRSGLVVDAAFVAANLSQAGMRLLDARSAERFRDRKSVV